VERDLSRSRAILIGNSIYQVHPRIPNLPAARTCVDAMAQLLTGDLCRWPPDRITEIVDVVAPSTLASRVLAAVRDAEDVLLVYYVGHGIRTSEGQLALAVGESDPDPEALPHTSMLYENLARILRGSRAATKLVILDCCHAELANRANYVFQSADVAEAYPVDGLYFIGASAKDKKAKAPPDGSLTYFTDTFIQVVHAGIPHRPPTLRLDQIFLELRARLLRASLPEPVESGTRGAHQFPFARNAAPYEVPVDYEAEYMRLRDQLAGPGAPSAERPAPDQDVDPLRRAPADEPPETRTDPQTRPRADLVAETNTHQYVADRSTSYVHYQRPRASAGADPCARRHKTARPYLAVAVAAGAGSAYPVLPWLTSSLTVSMNSVTSGPENSFTAGYSGNVSAWASGVSAWWLSPAMLALAILFGVIALNPTRLGTERALRLATGLGGVGAIALTATAWVTISTTETAVRANQIQGFIRPGSGCFVGVGCALAICGIGCWTLNLYSLLRDLI
jgi:Caspase domain